VARRNLLARPPSTADIIVGLRLDQADITPAARDDAARAAIPAMTDAQRAAMAGRNQRMMAGARAMMNAADRSVGAVLHACPRCGAEARGNNEGDRLDWFAAHYNRAHGGYR
jgi:hypothetical protein